MNQDIEIAKALRVINDAWTEQSKASFVQQALNQPVQSLPPFSQADAERRADVGRKIIAAADKVDLKALPHDLATTLKVVRLTAERWSKEGEWWWLVQDPMGVGFFGMFGPTAYTGGFLINGAHGILSKQTFERRGDLDRYLGLVADYTNLFDEMRIRLQGQADRQIVMPRPQLEQAKGLMAGLRAAAPRVLAVASERVGDLVGAERFQRELSALIEGPVADASGALIGVLEGDYGDRAGERVGIDQYPGGAEVYAELVKLHTTMDLTPEQVHQKGLQRMKEIRAGMAEIRAQAGFAGDDKAYLEAIAGNPAWRAQGAEAIGAMFQRYIDRIAPHIDSVFRFKPKAPHGVEALPEALQGSMTFGFYDTPSAPGERGLYYFNPANLSQGPLAGVASLNYHELVPGHHFHMATQLENETLHPSRAHAFFNAFNEGWAEYASTLAGEMGMYPEPEERFGRLMMDAFLCCRLVVDTGMNALGWTLEQARDYQRENAFMPEKEIRSESVRYSCDIPGQSLAYKLGDAYLMAERERMKAALGDRFDIRDFHDAVLKPGGLPLPLVRENVDRAIAEAVAA